MAIEIHWYDGLSCAVVVCDVCGERIEQTTETDPLGQPAKQTGVVDWRDVKGPFYFSHNRCSQVMKRWLNEAYPDTVQQWRPVNKFLQSLVFNHANPFVDGEERQPRTTWEYA